MLTSGQDNCEPTRLMRTFFRGKVVRIMPKEYDEEFKVRAVWLVNDHVEEYDSRTACIMAIAKRLGVSYETLRRWVNQSEIDTAARDGLPTDVTRENRELRRRNKELEETIEILKAATSFFVRRATHDAADLRFHRRASCSVRGRSDLPVLTEHGCQIAPRTLYAWLSRPPSARSPVGHGHHRGVGRLLRARRARSTQAGVVWTEPRRCGPSCNVRASRWPAAR